MTTSAGAAVGVAFALDALLREPPLEIHPVRMAGRYLRAIEPHVPAQPPLRAAVAGGLAWAAGAATAVAAGVAAERAAGRLRPAPRAVALGVGLWPLFAHRMLLDAVREVDEALAVDLDAGRAAVSRLVSRDVSDLTATQVRAAAIESLAENLSDSVVAPLLWFGVGGLPAVALYRYANTADAMWGYRTDRWRHAGSVAARADDVLNLLPARVSSLALAGRHLGWRRLGTEAKRTPSPNAGWPMAGIALRLGIRLEKPDVYCLAPTGREPKPADTREALLLAKRAGLALVGVAAVIAALRGRRWQR